MKNDNHRVGNFYQRVYDIVALIPHGKVTTYGAIARALGTAGSARMVGWALMAAHSPDINLPIYRVVNRRGLLTGMHHYDYPGKMQELLEREGIRVRENQVQEFEKVFWEPS